MVPCLPLSYMPVTLVRGWLLQRWLECLSALMLEVKAKLHEIVNRLRGVLVRNVQILLHLKN